MSPRDVSQLCPICDKPMLVDKNSCEGILIQAEAECENQACFGYYMQYVNGNTTYSVGGIALSWVQQIPRDLLSVAQKTYFKLIDGTREKYELVRERLEKEMEDECD